MLHCRAQQLASSLLVLDLGTVPLGLVLGMEPQILAQDTVHKATQATMILTLATATRHSLATIRSLLDMAMHPLRQRLAVPPMAHMAQMLR